MAVSIARLRRWFVGALILVCLVVAGTYFYARHRVQNALKQVPGKIGINIQQSAQGFTISKSEQGRTLFTLQANKAVQFKQGGRAELHDVTITLYGRDSSRFDQVYGADFEYDPQSGNVTSQGEVSIDLQANPQGVLHPDQATPEALKNPIHLKTTGLVFNKNTGDAWTAAAIQLRVPQANGSAVGAQYSAKQGTLTLQSQVRVVVNAKTPSTIVAERAVLTKNPREIVLARPRAESSEQNAQADELTLFLNQDNTLHHAVATGNVRIDAASNQPASSRTKSSTHERSEILAQKLDVTMNGRNNVKAAVFSGDVQFRSEGRQQMHGSAARAALEFAANRALSKVRAEGGVKLVQASGAPQEVPSQKAKGSVPEDFQITAPAIDFLVVHRKLTRAETIGQPEISIVSASSQKPAAAGALAAPTRITADRFVATFNASGQVSRVQGSANARVVSPALPQNGVAQPDRVTTSDSIDAVFRPGSGIESIVQQGRFAYHAGSEQAFAERARYTATDQMLTLTGSPRIVDAGMQTTSDSIRLNRATGSAFAHGTVKTSYSDLKPDPNGALLAGSDPVHVTAQSMQAQTKTATATYTGNARLWQNANVIEAPSIRFEKQQRTVIADATADQKVSTVLIGTDKNGKATPVTVTSAHLEYRDSQRKAHFDGGVTVRSSDLTIAARQMDVFLAPPSRPSAKPTDKQPAAHSEQLSPAHLDRIVASGSVVINEPNRRATGEQLVYTVSDERFVLTGGPPSIFDAEHGKITAVSLTLFRRDGRVVVEGDRQSPAVTETKVVR